MRKSILIGVLAALMLFAFTACEPGTNTVIQESGNKTAMVATLIDFDGYLAGTTAAEAGLDNGVSVVANITYDNGYVLENVAGKLTSASAVVPGTNWGTFTYGDSQTLNVQFNGVPATELKLEVAETAKTEYVEADITSATETIDTDDITATLVFENGEEISAKSVSYKFNGTAAASYYDSTAVIATVTGTGLTADGKDLTAEYKIEVTDYEPTAPVVTKSWAINVNGEAGTAVSIDYNQTKNDVVSQITVVETTTTDGVAATRILTNGVDYVIQGIPSGALTTNGTFNVVPLIDMEGITFTTKNGTYTVEDSVDWNTLSVAWAQETTENLRVGGTLSSGDVKVTLNKLSGTAVSSPTVTFVGVSTFPATDYTEGQVVNVRVKVTSGDHSEIRDLTPKALGAAKA